ncbi:inositol polyphosphate-5-phosphatase A isoform X12 [Ailuropoda melanoleuca]|uniref:inositol polyphosphate-5-phosphatase A isoform X12 n=1 Tax=Ailuropoda melanoleuca TaxID=9646 RepID=UPI0014949EE5|nr:inositol polyphosphate-5-phosphatase A isoform X12 [Ailuropoda melanoleuca]
MRGSAPVAAGNRNAVGLLDPGPCHSAPHGSGGRWRRGLWAPACSCLCRALEGPSACLTVHPAHACSSVTLGRACSGAAVPTLISRHGPRRPSSASRLRSFVSGVDLIWRNHTPENLQKNWLREFYQVVHTHKPHFMALHCQEFGGKNYEASMSHVDKFVKELLSSDAMKEYNRARVYLDENFKSQEHFTRQLSGRQNRPFVWWRSWRQWAVGSGLPAAGREGSRGQDPTGHLKPQPGKWPAPGTWHQPEAPGSCAVCGAAPCSEPTVGRQTPPLPACPSQRLQPLADWFLERGTQVSFFSVRMPWYPRSMLCLCTGEAREETSMPPEDSPPGGTPPPPQPESFALQIHRVPGRCSGCFVRPPCSQTMQSGERPWALKGSIHPRRVPSTPGGPCLPRGGWELGSPQEGSGHT